MTKTTNYHPSVSVTLNQTQVAKENVYRTHSNLIAVETLLTQNNRFWGNPITNDREYNYSLELEGQLFSRYAIGRVMRYEEVVGMVVRKPNVRGGLSVMLRPVNETDYANTFFVFVNDSACFEGSETFSPDNLKPSIENPYYLGVFSNGENPSFYDILTLEEEWR